MCIIEDYHNREGDFKYMNMFELEMQVKAINKFIRSQGRTSTVHPWQLEKLKQWQDLQTVCEKEQITVDEYFESGRLLGQSTPTPRSER